MSKHKYLINLAKEYHFIIDKKLRSSEFGLTMVNYYGKRHNKHIILERIE